MSDQFENPPAIPQTPVPVISYAAPSYGEQSAAHGVWRDGRIIVYRQHASLPNLCVKCGGPPVKILKRNMTWYPPVAYAGLLLGLIPFALIALFTQKKATVLIPLCDSHARARNKSLLISWCLALAGIGILILGAMMSNTVLTISGIVLFVAAVIIGIVGSNPLTPKKIDNRYAYLKGAGQIFLDQLPDVRATYSQPTAP